MSKRSKKKYSEPGDVQSVRRRGDDADAAGSSYGDRDEVQGREWIEMAGMIPVRPSTEPWEVGTEGKRGARHINRVKWSAVGRRSRSRNMGDLHGNKALLGGVKESGGRSDSLVITPERPRSLLVRTGIYGILATAKGGRERAIAGHWGRLSNNERCRWIEGLKRPAPVAGYPGEGPQGPKGASGREGSKRERGVMGLIGNHHASQFG
ncbi:hypothetical protein C8R45DRAFT_946250 [Mycena sanguinolenta]|nr:hypothetical protein C8R45DRAFT_946250 [Mycena sanguinolenta]